MEFKFQYSDYEEENPAKRRVAAIFQALGAASVCWEHPEGAGIFDSTRCRDIGLALLNELDIIEDGCPCPFDCDGCHDGDGVCWRGNPDLWEELE